jgi:CBS domain-containing protein
MGYVREVLQVKGSNVWSIAPKASVYEALEIMADKNVGALLVIDKGKIVGIFSERDYARKVILKGKSSKKTSVGELMTREVSYVEPGDSMEHCMALMTAKRIRHLPVMENNQLVGIVSIGDVVKRVISEQEFTIEQLEKYIRGGYVV